MTTHHRSRVGLQKPFDIWNRMVHCFLFLFFFFTYIYTHPRDASVGIDEIEKKLYITCRWHWPLNISSSKCVLGSILCLRNKLNAWSASLLELPKQWFSKSRCMHRGQRPNWAHSSKKKKKRCIQGPMKFQWHLCRMHWQWCALHWVNSSSEKMLLHVTANVYFALIGQHAPVTPLEGATGLALLGPPCTPFFRSV